MKKLFWGLCGLLMLFAATTVSADVPAPGGPFATAFRIQNLSTSAATCTVQFYNADGSVANSFSTTSPIAAGDSLLVYTPTVSGLPTGQFSGVVSCDQEVAAVVNFSDADSGASHNGISANDLATTWYAPGIYRNYFNFYSDIVVQNATGSPVNITLKIYAPGNSTPISTETKTSVPANASVAFDQSTNTSLAQNVAYSAVIEGTGNIAPIVNIYGLASANNQLYSYNPFTSGSTIAYAPVIMNGYFGYNTALTVQNIDTTTAQVTVSYGTGQQQTASIPPGSSSLFYTPTSGIPSGTLTGATVTSTNGKQIVALVNESNNFNRAASYSGFSTGSTSVSVPIVMKRYFEYNSSVTCQNVGNAPATMKIAYNTGTQTTTGSIAAGATTLFYQPTVSGLSNGFIGNATITSAQPIVCVVNQDKNEGTPASTVQDQLFAYEGIGN